MSTLQKENEQKIHLSLELLSEVIVDHITNVKIECESVTFGGDITEYVMLDWWKTMELSELAVKCKEWALNTKGFTITTNNLKEIFEACELLVSKDDID